MVLRLGPPRVFGEAEAWRILALCLAFPKLIECLILAVNAIRILPRNCCSHSIPAPGRERLRDKTLGERIPLSDSKTEFYSMADDTNYCLDKIPIVPENAAVSHKSPRIKHPTTLSNRVLAVTLYSSTSKPCCTIGLGSPLFFLIDAWSSFVMFSMARSTDLALLVIYNPTLQPEMVKGLETVDVVCDTNETLIEKCNNTSINGHGL